MKIMQDSVRVDALEVQPTTNEPAIRDITRLLIRFLSTTGCRNEATCDLLEEPQLLTATLGLP
jgi:hypothetical protein